MHRTTMTILAAAGLVAAGAAFAQQEPASKPDNWGAVRTACAADLKTYCSASTGREQKHACIKENRAKFSAGCQSAITAAHHAHESSSPSPQ